jgi:hypothetical protein
MSSDSTQSQSERSCAPFASGRTVAAWAFGATLLGGALGFANGAAAQAQQPGIGAQNAPGEVQTAPQAAKPNEPLSDTLSRTQGVVTPPSGVDPGIHAPAPEPDPRTTPVIPPPGTPGGNQNVQPK